MCFLGIQGGLGDSNVAPQTRRESGVVDKQAENFLEMHRYDAKQLGIADGDMIQVSSRRGTVSCRAAVSKRTRPGCVWMPLHSAESAANRLTNDAGDSVTGTGEYKVCAVRVAPVR